MSVNRTISLSDEQDKFVQSHNISLSAMAQDKIIDLMKISDPVHYQAQIKAFEKKATGGDTLSQRMLLNEPDYSKRTIIILDFLEKLGMNTKNWVERVNIENKMLERHERG